MPSGNMTTANSAESSLRSRMNRAPYTKGTVAMTAIVGSAYNVLTPFGKGLLGSSSDGGQLSVRWPRCRSHHCLPTAIEQSDEPAGPAAGLSLAEAKKIRTSTAAIDAARYFLAYQHLLYGAPNEALAESEPLPSGIGHSQCLLHSVAAQALWKLSRHDEAVLSARQAIEAAPTEEPRSELSLELAAILGAG